MENIIKTVKDRAIVKGLIISMLVASFSFSVISCGDDEDDNTQAQLTVQEVSARGWESFKDADYSSALTDFSAVIQRDANYSDAYNGAGWSVGRLPNRLSEAGAYFSRSLQLDTSRYDALGGWSFVEYQLGNYQSSLNKADSLLNRRPGWRFLHQPSVDFRKLRLTKAAAYYSLEQFSNSLSEIRSYLNADFEADVATQEGRRELLSEIERLRRIYG